MVGKLLLRGMLVGVLAGLLSFAFARIYGEPLVASAIAFEEAQSPATGEPAEPEIVSRETQAGIGLFTGIMVYSAAIGGLFSLAFAALNGRIGHTGVRATSAIIALAGFLVIVLVPALKYPPNPPAVGDAETIGIRTQLYFIMLLGSLLALAAAFGIGRSLRSSLGDWNAGIVGVVSYVLLVTALQFALPDINEVPEQFSALLLWRFRVASLGIQLILWTTLGLLFGAIVHKSFGHLGRPQSAW